MRCLSADLLRHQRPEEPEPPHPKGFLVRVFNWPFADLCASFAVSSTFKRKARQELARTRKGKWVQGRFDREERSHYRTERGSAGSLSQVRIIMDSRRFIGHLKLTLASGATALGSVKPSNDSQVQDGSFWRPNGSAVSIVDCGYVRKLCLLKLHST